MLVDEIIEVLQMVKQHLQSDAIDILESTFNFNHIHYYVLCKNDFYKIDIIKENNKINIKIEKA